jgi:hypothetical protein
VGDAHEVFVPISAHGGRILAGPNFKFLLTHIQKNLAAKLTRTASKELFAATDGNVTPIASEYGVST